MRKWFFAHIACSLFALHALTWTLLEWVRSAGPQQNLRLSSSAQGLLLHGQSRFGFTVFRIFPTWRETEEYMAAQNLVLPPLAEAFVTGQRDAALARAPQDQVFKLSWDHASPTPKVLHTPDLASARTFLEHLRYRGLELGPMGYNIPLLKVH